MRALDWAVTLFWISCDYISDNPVLGIMLVATVIAIVLPTSLLIFYPEEKQPTYR